jgi:hypothetical protein
MLAEVISRMSFIRLLGERQNLSLLLYIDPGNGTLIVQIILAGITGALFYFGKLWTRLKKLLVKEEQSIKNGK